MKFSISILAFLFVRLAASQPGLSCPDSPKLPSSAFAIPGNASYDYVIIGGGTAGNVVAARLAETGVAVAVIEAGGFYEVDNGNLSVIPGLAGKSVSASSPLVDWGYFTTPQAGALGREIPYPRGKTLGGSSARNIMVYQRGTKGSYQAWADAVGDDTYTFDNLLPHFKDTTTFTPPDYTKRNPNSSLEYDATVFDHGPLQVSYANYASPVQTWVQKAFTALGLAPNNGFNSGNLLGGAWSAQSADPKTEERSSSQTSFLNEAICNTDIQIYTRSLAEKILFSSNKTATGVVVSTAGEEYVLTARKEVILSGGAVNSPQTLLLSGIGDPAILSSFDIPVIAPLKGVGQNLWEHGIWVTASHVSYVTSSHLPDPVFAAEQAQDYLLNQTGMYTAAAGLISWEKVPQPYRSNLTLATQQALSVFAPDWPELEYLSIDSYFGEPPDNGNYLSLLFALASPLSRGNVTIASTSASDLALVNPNWLTHPADVEVAIAGFKRIRETWAALRAIKPDLVTGEEILVGYPGNATTDAEIIQFLRQTVGPVYHPSCTCKMGKEDDEWAVVDSKGRVFGVNGLRVVDASIFPLLPPGHPQATVYALGSKIASDIIGHSY